ncbi:MAG: DUF488 family protein, N3 subclade [Acidiphilium sp.]
MPEDGSRVLVDQLWPRGLAREKAKFMTERPVEDHV